MKVKIAEIAARANRGERTIRHWMDRGLIPRNCWEQAKPGGALWFYLDKTMTAINNIPAIDLKPGRK